MLKRMLWCDAEANCSRLDNLSAVSDLVRNAVCAGIDSIIVDVKPLSGQVLYLSDIAPRLDWVGEYRYPPDFDLLGAMVDAGHKAGIEIHAAMNVFCEGHRQWGRGPGYSNPEWQVISYEADRIIELPNLNQVRVESIDPWDKSTYPAIFTKKTGRALKSSPDRFYAVIRDDVIENIIISENDDIVIPDDGCILALNDRSILSGIEIGDRMKWSHLPMKRLCENSIIPSWGIFVNPIGAAREYELSIIREIVSKYDIDGIVFDRMRYPNLFADFSEISLDTFGKWLGTTQTVSPDDIFTFNDKPWLPIIPGRLYRQWLKWRAWQIHNFAEDAVSIVRSLKPGIDAGIYVGSWYESYYDVGVNWGSQEYHPGYDWMTPDYNQTGYAELFDFICTGCYYPTVTREDARKLGKPEGATVEAGCQLSMKAIDGASRVYGSLYLRDYNGNPDGFRRAADIASTETDGVMFFDLVYVEEYEWWCLLRDIAPERLS